MEILLSVPEVIRNAVLDVKPLQGSEIEIYVYGCNSEKYQTFGAPLEWDSLFIAKELEKYIKLHNLEALEWDHINIFEACLVKEFKEEEIDKWITIFQELKSYFFIAMCDSDLSLLSIEILKKFFMNEKMQSRIMEICKEVIVKTLSLLYQPDCDQECKDNCREFIEFLHDNNSSNQNLKNFVYNVIKKFADQSKNLFLKSNLMQLSNRIVEERRGQIFGEAANEQKS